MGHLLATVNPEAAAAIRPAIPASELPAVGEVLKFYPRPGEGRGGLAEFAVHVTRVHEDGRIDGIVWYDAQDARDVVNVPQITDQHPWPAWDWLRQGEPSDTVMRGDAPPVSSVVEQRLRALEAAVETLENAGSDAVLTVLRERIVKLERSLAQAEKPSVLKRNKLTDNGDF